MSFGVELKIKNEPLMGIFRVVALLFTIYNRKGND
jgi:hypothetical protein